jgi:dTDP-glucose 4,6-dehydratase
VRALCAALDAIRPHAAPHSKLIRFVADRPGHDRRYAIDAGKIRRELSWEPKQRLESGLHATAEWYLANKQWTQALMSGEYRRWLDTNYGSRAEL